jgi:putative ABC transport system permease protein
MPSKKLKAWRDIELQSGNWPSFVDQDDAAFVGVDVATRRGLSPGDKFTIGDVSVVVRGVFLSATAAENSLIFTQLDFLQRARGASDVGTVTQLEVHLHDTADPETVAKQIDRAFRSGPVATTTRTKGMFQADTLADLAELIGFVHWLGYACVGLVLALVATTTVMSVQDRIKEHAVLQTLGVRPLRVFRLVVTESLLLAVFGGLIGVAGSMAFLSSTGLAVAAEGVTIAFQPSWDLATHGIIIACAVGLIAGLVPGWQASRAAIVPALRNG